MAELVTHAGFEWATTAGLTTGNSGNRVFDSSAGTFTVEAAAARTGSFGLRVALASSWVAWTTSTVGAGRTVVVGSLYLRFPTFLPGVDTVFLSLDTAAGTSVAYLKFSPFNARVYVGAGGTELPSSVTFAADTWYRLDFRWDVSASPHVFEWQIDGVAQTQVTGDLPASTFDRVRLGCPAATSPGSFVDFDDVLVSVTASDFPLGEHKVELLSVDSGFVREFDGVDDVIECSPGLVPTNQGDSFVVALWKPLAVEPGGILRALDVDTDTTVFGLNQFSDGNVYMSYAGFTSVPYTVSDGWRIDGFGRDSADDPIRVHTYSSATTTWLHEDRNVVGSSTALPDLIRFGQSAATEYGAMRLAVAAIYPTHPTDLQVESLAAGIDAWETLGPVAMCRFDQNETSDPVLDVTGNGADQTSITGTTVVRGDPPDGFDFGTEQPAVSGSTDSFNTFTANGTLAPWDPAVALQAIDDATPTLGADADGVAQVGTAAGEYVQVPMSSYTLQSGEAVMGVRMLACGWAANAAAATIGLRSWNGTTESVIAPTADPNFDNSATNPAWLCRQLPAADIHTQVELDALAFRIGFSDNATVPVGIHALFAEVAVAQGIVGTPGFGNPATVSAAAGVLTPSTTVATVTVPASVPAAAAVPVPVLVTHATVTPAAVAATAAVPALMVMGGSTRTPAAVAAAVSIPAPDVSAGAGPSPATVTAVVDVPGPTVTTSGFGTANPATVAAQAVAATPGLSTGAAGLPGPVAASASVQVPTRSAGTTANPAAVLARAVAMVAQAFSKATEHHAAVHRIFARIARGSVRRSG